MLRKDLAAHRTVISRRNGFTRAVRRGLQPGVICILERLPFRVLRVAAIGRQHRLAILAQLGEEAGFVQHRIAEQSAIDRSTETMPLHMVADLVGEHGIDAILGIEIDHGHRAIFRRIIKRRPAFAQALVLDRQIRMGQLHRGQAHAIGLRHRIEMRLRLRRGQRAAIAAHIRLLPLAEDGGIAEALPLAIAGAG